MTEPEPYTGPCRRAHTDGTAEEVARNVASGIAEKIAQEFVDADTRSDWQDEINKVRYQHLTVVVRSTLIALAVACLCVGIVGAVTLAAARKANGAAGNADRAGTCSTLLLSSVADNKIDPQAQSLGCDTAVASELIARGKKRDADAVASRKIIHDDVCKFINVLKVPPTDPSLAQFRKDFQC